MSNWSPTYKAVCDICGETQEVSNYGDWACRQCGQGYTYDECHQIRLTDAQWSMLRNPPRWIPVEERLPVDVPHGYCLVTDGTNVGTANWSKCGNCFDHCIDRDYWKPTHWMPLPEPPAS